MACVMAMSADATFSGTVLLCPFSLEQPHDIADGMCVQVSAAPLTGCLAVYAEVPERDVRVCVDGACGTECYDMHMYLLWLVPWLVPYPLTYRRIAVDAWCDLGNKTIDATNVPQ